MGRPRKDGRIYLNGKLLSSIESEYLKDIAKDAGVSVTQYIKLVGGEAKLEDYLDKLEFDEPVYTHTRHFIDQMESQNYSFILNGQFVSKNDINLFLSGYYRGAYKKSMLIFNFKINPIKMTVELESISQYVGGKTVYSI